jgi:outer membrane protein assembly factor BamB
VRSNYQTTQSPNYPIAAAVCLVLATAFSAAAADWPQFLGPERNGVYSGPPLAKAWPAGGPRVVWRRPVGQGFAGPVVTGGRVIIFHRIGAEEIVESLDAATGASQWRFAYPTTYRDDFGFDEGPRAVPVIANGLVFTFGAQGVLTAIEVATGRGIWSVDTQKEFAPRLGFFGRAGSPLVEDGRVLANIGDSFDGGGIMAFNADTGAVLWQATRHEASYSSPVSAMFDGRRRALFFTRRGLVGLDPATGAIAFEREWRSRSDNSVNAATPLIIGDRIFLSATYGTGAAVLRVKGDQLTEVWANDDTLSNHYATSVHHAGTLYGFHGRQEFGPAFRAVDLATGTVQWSEEKFRAGTVTLAGDRLLILRESGELVMAEATPQAFRPIARAQVLRANARGYPALADGFLYARNTDTPNNELVVLDLR